MAHQNQGKSRNDSRRALGLLVLRIGLGIVFIGHGLQHIHGISQLVPFFHKLGFGTFLAYLDAYGEVLGGIALILGVFTRLASWLLALIMLIVLVDLKRHSPIVGMNGSELEFMLFSASVALGLIGPGTFSLGPTMCYCCNNGNCKEGGCACHVACDTTACTPKE